MNGRIAARAAWGAALAAVLVLSGCVAEPAPTPSPTASPSRTPSATPTPTSTPTPDGPQPGTPTPSPTAGADPSWPAYDPADPGTWTIDFSGIGPFTVGRPMEEQVAAFTGLARDDCGGNPGVASYHAPGTWLAAVEFNGGDVGLVSAAARSGGEPAVRPHTAEGIRPGDSVAAVLAAYPGIQAHVHSSSASYFVTDGTTWINFVVEGADSVDALHPDDVVGLITVGTLEFAPKEICG